MTTNWIIATIVLCLLAIRFVAYLLKYWEHKQIKRRFYDGTPRAWYPPNPKPSLFNYKKPKQ